MEEYFLESRGLYYRTNRFKAGRPTIVFMHGLSGHASAWEPYENLVGEQANILTFDLRGHGRSLKHKTYEAYTMNLFAEDLRVLREHLRIDQFILVTHSFGCLIALEFARHYREFLSGLILMSPSFGVSDPRVRFVKPLLSMVRAFAYAPLAKRRGCHFDYAPHGHARDWDLHMTYDDVRNTGLRAYLFCSRQALEVSYDDLLEAIAVPTLLIHGRADSIFPFRNSVVMEQRMPNARAVLLDAADHILVVNRQHFRRISREVVRFLGEFA